MNRHKLDTRSCRMFINDEPCNSVVSLYIDIMAGQPKIHCDVICISQDPYTQEWIQHRGSGYVEQIYANSFYIILDKDQQDTYFQQFMSA